MKHVYVFNFTQNFHHFKSKVSEAPFHGRPQTAIPSVLHATDWGITGTHLGTQSPYSLVFHAWGCFRATDYSARAPKKFYVSTYQTYKNKECKT